MGSGKVDAAVIGLLQADAQLKAWLPDGVYFSAAPQSARRFALVSVTTNDDEYIFQGRQGFEEFLYLIKAVILSTSPSDALQAADRIQALLQNARFPITGYQVVNCQRAGYVRYTEPDVNPDALWQHIGGNYAVVVAPTETSTTKAGAT